MRRAVLIMAVGAMALAGGSTASAIPLGTGQGVKVRVSPRTGHPRTTFTFRLRLPSQLPMMIRWSRRDTLSVIGPGDGGGCVAAASAELPSNAAGAAVSVRLDPARLGADGRWCVGRFRGTVLDTQRVICSPPVYILCPEIMIAPQVIARFTFRVARAA